MEFINDYINIYATGITVSTYNNGQTKFYKYGYAQVKPKKIEITKETEFDIASITKLFTSTLIYKLVERGKIGIKQKIYDIDSKYKNLKNISIEQLLAHKTNLWTPGYIGDASNEAEINYLLYNAKPVEKQKLYCDAHYMILGKILEEKYKKSLRQIYREEIFNPLGLNSANFKSENAASCNYEIIDNQIITNIPTGIVYDKKARKAQEFGKILGHAGIFINSEDLMKFLTTFIDKKERLLKNNTIEYMMKYYGEKNSDNKLYTNCGLKYYHEVLSNNNIINNPKNTVDFSGYTGPCFAIDFDKNIIISIMSNICHNTVRDPKNKTRKKIIDEVYKNIIKN